MSKYFKEEKEEQICFSQYVDSSKYVDSKAEREYLIKILGDIRMEPTMIKLFCLQFHRYGGMYDVNKKPETIETMYEMIKLYPFLSKRAVEEIWIKYIKDLFDKYDLIKILDKFILIFGKTDEAFEQYMYYIDKKAEDYQEKFKKEMIEVEELEPLYSKSFVEHLKYLIRKKHISYEDIKKFLPDSELIRKDEEHIIDLSKRTRIFFGCCLPVSYKLFDCLVEKESLEFYEEELKYYADTGLVEKVTFTKQEFLDSIEKQKIKTL